MKTILITGGAGFIGSAFTHYIYNNFPDYRIIVLDCLTYAGVVENLPVPIWQENDERFVFWYGNVINGELMDTLVSESDMVVHFAAESHVTRSIYDNIQFFRTDVLGTQIVANAVCKYRDRIERFVHISTSEVYGTSLTDKIDEEHPLNPMSPYAAAKAGADRLVYSYWATYGIPAVIIRPFNNFGPRQHLEKVIPRFITSILLKEQLRVHGQGTSARDFVYVEDNCEAIDLALHAPEEKVVGETFNVGSGQHRSILSIAEDIIEMMCPEENNCVMHVGDRPGQVIRHTADTSKIETILGWKPKTDWRDGLLSTIEWYSENVEWWKKQMWMREIPIISASGKRELH
jgi:dTDP-glucose 4,6-dehydratase